MSERTTAHQASNLPQDSWRRWQMDSFQTTSPTIESSPPPVEPEETATRLRKLEDRAQQRGHEAGYAAGQAEGLAAGTTTGTEAGHQAGYATGHAEGLKAGYAQGLAKAQEEAAALQTLATTFAATLSRIEEDLGQGVIALSIGIAEQIVRDTVAAHPESLLPLVREIVQLHGDNDAVLIIHVHPDNHDLLRKHLTDDASVKRWRLIPDEAIEPGGCSAHTALGAVDATLATRWRRAVTALGHPAVLPPEPSC